MTHAIPAKSDRNRQAHLSCQDSEGILTPAPALNREFRDAKDFPLMIELPAGEFIMGENPGDKFANDTERPAHRVSIVANFALGKFPVTVGEFARFRGNYSIEEANDLPVIRVS